MSFNIVSLLLIGTVAACALQALQKYEKIGSFFNVKLFFALTLLSAACWIIGLAIGGWGGMSLTSVGLNGLVVAVSGLVSSFLLNMVLGK
ncbi:hypothetical protein CN378_18595 [Bacillus sp. AFS015802]|uniref:hypothetical protein n=1 Tax=Bacillus sp. AFS015802 TaxID=2033486 RepID=UPI000BFAE542|nr:hypothetical protein [Bacillus sp. AFS015802]PFA63046.1 hypothetical protein CN378_18595 [Bacillus sp. AFS015802]